MIIGIGNDIIDIRRIEKAYSKFGDKFIDKICNEQEAFYIKSFSSIVNSSRPNNNNSLESKLAKRFSTKEACAKALGTGIGKAVSWHDIETSHTPNGKPTIKLATKIEYLLLELYNKKISTANQQNIKSFGQYQQYQNSNNLNYTIDLSISDEYPYAISWIVISVI